MSRLRELTERDRLGPLVEQILGGQAPDLRRALALQSLDLAAASRAAMLDALDREAAADDLYAETLRQLGTEPGLFLGPMGQ